MGFLSEHLFGKLSAPTPSLNGRTVLVTGSNQGLGLWTAIHLAKLSPGRLILAVRDVTKGKEAAEKISSITGYAKTEVFQLDLASFDSVKAFAAKCDELERLDVVVENAGIATRDFSRTGDGYESTLQVNALATGLLGVLLLPLLSKTAKLPDPNPASPLKPHLTIVSSEVHGWATFSEKSIPGSTLSALNAPESSTMNDRYNVSKLLDVFITRQIATLPSATSSGIVVNTVNPGLCVSELRKELPSLFAWFANKVARSTEYGSLNIVWAALEDTKPGAYVSSCKEINPSDYAMSKSGMEMEKKIWSEMSGVWRGVAPEVASTLGSSTA